MQLGVARGTVRVAYERLADERLIETFGPAGSFVVDHPPAVRLMQDGINDFEAPTIPAEFIPRFGAKPLPFQIGIPGYDAFPTHAWSRITARAARRVAARGVYQPDPRGEPELRAEIAAHLSIARSISCASSRVFVTNGYAGALGLIFSALDLKNSLAWVEEPGFPYAWFALNLAGITAIPVTVDSEGLVVAEGVAAAPEASLAIVTSGQQAPLGMPLATSRRQELLTWASESGAWVLDDDYLSELQLSGRAAPALASIGDGARVLHVGSFSKTINPALRLGFVVVPDELVERFNTAAILACPASAIDTQLAVTEFMRDGHYLRHLRKMKRVYVDNCAAVKASMGERFPIDAMAGLAVLLDLPAGTDDRLIAEHAMSSGMAPVALSSWYARSYGRRSGLLLGITNIDRDRLDEHCAALGRLIDTVG